MCMAGKPAGYATTSFRLGRPQTLFTNKTDLLKQQLSTLEDQTNKMRDLLSVNQDILNNSYT